MPPNHPQDHARELAAELAHFDQMAADMAEIIYMEQTRAEDQRLQRVLDPVENLFYLDLGHGRHARDELGRQARRARQRGGQGSTTSQQGKGGTTVIRHARLKPRHTDWIGRRRQRETEAAARFGLLELTIVAAVILLFLML